MLNSIFAIVPLISLLALTFAYVFFRQMMKSSEGTDAMKRIAQHVRTGAGAYLRQQYKVVIVVFIVITIIFSILAYGLGVQNKWVPFAFITGGAFSGLAGFFGMKAATFASARVAHACRTSLNGGLKLAFRSGAVMGLVVVGLVLMDISIWFLILNHFIEDMAGGYKLMTITAIMLTFGMGASTQALFARVGGGIYTKAADVGADLVGKVEANIPEDDPRNPATIADNVGDNVGDVAGMGADLFESFAASILASALLGAAAYFDMGDVQLGAVLAPMIIAAIGTLLSIVGIFLVRTREGASQKELLRSLNIGVYFSAALIVVLSYFALKFLNLPNFVGIWGSIIAGLAAGIGIGQSTEYYTSASYKPTISIAKSSETGPATVIIAGVGTGFLSTAIPLLIVTVAIILSYCFATGFQFGADTINMGLYGIGIAAVGMLSTLGLTLATDAYGPIADNAGGNAEMARLGPEVRRRTDALDALGNTTASTGKGFAIGSAALTALALLAYYIEAIKVSLSEMIGEGKSFEFPNGLVIDSVDKLASVDMYRFMEYFQVNLINPKVLVGILLGSMMSFLFCG